MDLYAEKKKSDEVIAASEFIASYCRPMYTLQRWEASQLFAFKAVAHNFAGFARILTNLKTERGRKSVLQCIQDQVPLHGAGSMPGIPECQAVVAELAKLQALE